MWGLCSIYIHIILNIWGLIWMIQLNEMSQTCPAARLAFSGSGVLRLETVGKCAFHGIYS